MDDEKKEKNGSFFRTFLITFIIAFGIRVFIAQPFIVNGQSMDPTFESGQYLIIDEITYRFQEPERGDVIVFRYPKDPKKFFIKRIIGLPNEEINIDGTEVSIATEDGAVKVLDESYLSYTSVEKHSAKLGDNEYFVMGDNRTVSSDSRKWGSVGEDLIIGRALFRFIPLTKFSVMPGNFPDEFKN